MKVLVVGAGPAGLYLAYLLRRDAGARHAVRVVEQNPEGSTFGFGVVFSDRALDFLRVDDPATHDLLAPRMQRWSDLTLAHRGARVTIDGVGFAAIGRLALLRLMQERARSAGVAPVYGKAIVDEAELDGYDLVVAADGANSFVRGTRAAQFGTRSAALTNRFAWFGTTRRFETLAQTFVQAGEDLYFNAHHYRYDEEGMGTFIVECDAPTWHRAGFAAMDEAQTRRYLETVFADVLQGHALVANKSVWRRFPQIENARWSVGNRVLIGDAQRPAHFSIGSGTRLAFEDAIALASALARHGDDAVPAALADFEQARRAVVDKLVAAANRSADWYEGFAERMAALDPWQLAWSYVQRSGRVDVERLRIASPRFVADCEAHGVATGSA